MFTMVQYLKNSAMENANGKISSTINNLFEKTFNPSTILIQVMYFFTIVYLKFFFIIDRIISMKMKRKLNLDHSTDSAKKICLFRNNHSQMHDQSIAEDEINNTTNNSQYQ